MTDRRNWVLLIASTVLGALLGWAYGLVLQRAAYPHIVVPLQGLVWGCGTGLAAGLLQLLAVPQAKPLRMDLRACAQALVAGVAGTAGVMVASAFAWQWLLTNGILEVFAAWAVVNPSRQAMALATWQVRFAAGAFGVLLCVLVLCRTGASCKWQTPLAALCMAAIVGATVLAAWPVRLAFAPATHSKAADAPSVLALMRKVAAWQLAHPRHRATDWHNCPWHAGLLALHQASGEVRYREQLLRVAHALDWQLGPQQRLADDQCIGSVYLDLYRDGGTADWIESTRSAVDAMKADPRPGREEWWWCDALFMAPPVMARLAHVAGRPGDLEFLDTLFWDAVESLYDPAHQLFHRDEKARLHVATEGTPRFWGRGNAWVLAGLARTLPWLPGDHPTRGRYVALFQDMAHAVLRAQQPDGLWRSDLLGSGNGTGGETSATALFAFALAWGMNAGLLPESVVGAAIQRAWAGLASAVTEEGRLGWVQHEAREPGRARRFDWDTYASGALLLAGAEMIRHAGARHAALPASPTTRSRTEPPTTPGTSASTRTCRTITRSSFAWDVGRANESLLLRLVPALRQPAVPAACASPIV